MPIDKIGHVIKLNIGDINESVIAEPKVPCSTKEINNVLTDLNIAVDKNTYISQTATPDNPSLSDDYIFDLNDENLILKDLKPLNFVGKIKDFSKGAKKRKEKGYPEEYLYVFQYPCKLMRREMELEEIEEEDVLIYIKINNRKEPYNCVFIVSFHKNKPKKENK